MDEHKKAMEQYAAALDVRDEREQLHKACIDAYTRLADRQAAPSTSTATGGKDISTLRADLLSTQKSRSNLQTTLSTLQSDFSNLQKASILQNTQITTLNTQKAALERKLRDREEEIATRRKMVEKATDEMVALQLQLNIAEEKRETVERENAELVRRWMERMGREAEAVNRDMGWGGGPE